MKIDELLRKLEGEIKQTQQGLEQVESLERLKHVALIYSGEDKIISSHEIAEQIKNNPNPVKIMSGWSGLDALLGGFRLQQLIVLSAFTKHGKTTFLMDLTNRLKEHSPCWFPFEQSATELVEIALERKQDVPLFYTPQTIKGNKLEWIETKIVESIAKYNSKLFFIDQLDFIVQFSGENRADRIGDIMRGLKDIAKKWNIIIFLICHLKKTRTDENPDLEALKGSSSIAQEADTVILLWREMSKINGEVVITNKTNVSVQANRRTGKTGNVKMVFEDGKFIEKEWKSERQKDADANREFEGYGNHA